MGQRLAATLSHRIVVVAIGVIGAAMWVPTPSAHAASDGATAREIILKRGCHGCHIIPGIPEATGTIGPSLKGISARRRIAGGKLKNTPANMHKWLKNPKRVKVTMMPNLHLTESEIETLIDFFGTL